MSRPQPKQFTAGELAILEALGRRMDEHPDPDVAMFMTSVERNLMYRCVDWTLWLAERNPIFHARIMADIREAGFG